MVGQRRRPQAHPQTTTTTTTAASVGRNTVLHNTGTVPQRYSAKGIDTNKNAPQSRKEYPLRLFGAVTISQLFSWDFPGIFLTGESEFVLRCDDEARKDRAEANPSDGDDVGDGPDSRRLLHDKNNKIKCRGSYVAQPNSKIPGSFTQKSKPYTRYIRKYQSKIVE